MRLYSKYVVMILGSRSERPPPQVEAAYTRWLCADCPKGMVYLETPLDQDPRHLRGWRLGNWLKQLELLSAFPTSKSAAQSAVERLLAARNGDGLWDFGIQSWCPRFSDNYRHKGATAHDWTMRVTCLLNRYVN
jgi:hypothetical protein